MAGQFDCGFEEILPECNIPADLMVIILLNLPIKSLLRFKAVSKPWRCFISSPRFVNLHLRRQSVVANSNLLLPSEEEEEVYGLLTHIHEKHDTCVDTDVLILESPPLLESIGVSIFGEKRYYVFDSCNGLVGVCCFQPSRHSGLLLWNPATKKCRRVQLPDGDFSSSFASLGLYYVEATSDFKIVGWANTHGHSRIERPSLFVYTLSSDSWKKWDWNCDGAEKSPITFGCSTLIGGCMNWVSRTSGSKTVITAFDLTNGAMSFFRIPPLDSNTGMLTLASRGCLSLAILRRFGEMESGFEVWVMEEHGVEESWVKRCTIREPGLGVLPLKRWKEGEIGFSNRKEDSKLLTFYDPFNSKKYFLEFKSFPVGVVFSYVESLVSVGTVREELVPSQLAEG